MLTMQPSHMWTLFPNDNFLTTTSVTKDYLLDQSEDMYESDCVEI